MLNGWLSQLENDQNRSEMGAIVTSSGVLALSQDNSQ